MTARVRINGRAGDRVEVSDRGLCYGDGLFETVWVHRGGAPLWDRHMTRLAGGCQRLRLPPPDRDWLWGEVEAASQGLACAVVRITWTRGSGPRGYAPPTVAHPTCIVSAHACGTASARWYHRGLRMHLCRTRWSTQSALAGLKHLNRLEQILACDEWHDKNLGEGLMLDHDGHVISATAANVFLVRDGQLHTPDLERCGVAGTARAEVLARHPRARVAGITLAELEQADEVFLTSAVRGIVPVCELAEVGRWAVGPWVRALQLQWLQAGLPPQVPA